MKLKFILPVWFSLAVLAASASVPDAGEDVSLRRMVWAHYVGWAMPEQISLQPESHYFFPAYERSAKPYEDEVRRAIEAGLDGFFVDVTVQYKWRPGYFYTVENLLRGAEGTSFRVAPCLDVKTDVTNQIDQICWMLHRFGNHPNYPRVKEKYVIATYTYHEWSSEEWREMIAGCARKGFPLFVVGNVKPSCGLLSPELLDRYRDVFDVCYSFAYTGRERLSVEDEDRTVAEWCGRNGKLFMPCIHPGYLGAWLRGSNPGYIPFQGVDAQMRCFLSACSTGGRWLHFTSWNDHCETTLEPMLLTSGNRHLMRSMSDAFKNLPAAAEWPDVLFAYHREELPGTLLRFEMLRLPAKKAGTVEVAGQLRKPDGTVAAVLPMKRLSSPWERAEWLVPSGNLAHLPHLTPSIEMRCGDIVRRASFSPMYLRTPWIENQVTVRETFADRGRVPAKLAVRYGNGIVHAHVRFTNDVCVQRAILFKNDRPIGQFSQSPSAKGMAQLPVLFKGNCRFDAFLTSGKFHMVMRRNVRPGQDGFSWGGSFIRNQPHAIYQDRMSAWLEGPAGAELVIMAKGTTNRIALAELAQRRCVTAGDGTLELSAYPDCTLREMPRLDKTGGAFGLRLHDRAPGDSDAYFVRFELADGRICETDTIYPFAKGSVAMPILESPVTLETYPGDLSLPRIEPLVAYREFLTAPEDLPFLRSTVLDGRVAKASLRRAWWPLTEDGAGKFDDRMIAGVASGGFAESPCGKRGLKLSGSEKVRLPLREWPMDTARIEFEIMLEDAGGENRSIFYRKGHGAAFALRQLGDNRIEAVWSGGGKGYVWKIEEAEKASVVSASRLVPGRWTKVCLENDHRRLRVLIDGKVEGESSVEAFRSYGPVTVYIGRGEGAERGFRGMIRNLKIGPCTARER